MQLCAEDIIVFENKIDYGKGVENPLDNVSMPICMHIMHVYFMHACTLKAVSVYADVW